MHILLVEDSAGEAESTLRALRETRPENHLHWVKDGAEALDFLFCSGAYAGRDAGDEPALVLLDIKMPRIDGIEVLRRVKGSPLRAIPVVVMTSSAEERGVLQSYRLGASAYLMKPVQSEAVAEVLSKLRLS